MCTNLAGIKYGLAVQLKYVQFQTEIGGEHPLFRQNLNFRIILTFLYKGDDFIFVLINCSGCSDFVHIFASSSVCYVYQYFVVVKYVTSII